MAEWLKAAVLKTVRGESLSRVRIPLSPPKTASTRCMDNDTRKAGEAVITCISNARKFLEAAKILIDSESFREAYLLTLYAGEEIGKVVLIINYPCYTESEERIKSWKKRFLDHAEKFWFLRNIDEIEQGLIPTDVHEDDKKHKDTRLEICYVDYRQENFVNPREVTKEETVTLYRKIEEKLQNMEERHPTVEDAIQGAKFLKGLRRDLDSAMKMLEEVGFKPKE